MALYHGWRMIAIIGIVVVTLQLVIGIATDTVPRDNTLSRDGDLTFIHRLLTTTVGDDSEEPSFPPLFPFQTVDYVGFGLAALALLLAAGAGVGGGGMLVPIYILVLQFPVKHAIPLTSATVFGGAIVNNVLNWSKTHPNDPNRPLIDWDLMVLLEPMTIAGTLVGVLLNTLLPDIVILVCMVVLLGTTAYTTIVKANSLYQKETAALRKANDDNNNNTVNEKAPLLGTSKAIEKNSDTATTTTTPPYLEERSVTDLESRTALVKKQVRLDAIKLTILFATITVINLLKGSADGGPARKGFPTCDGACYWASQVFMVLMIFAFTFSVRKALLTRVETGGPVLSDIEWDNDKTITYPSLGILAGLVAGLSGVGGGIIIGPLMLALGVLPAVSSATSACMIFFTSATSTISYAIYGMLVPDYAIFCFLVGAVATYAGQTIMAVLLKRNKRPSYIAYCLGSIILVSALAMSAESIISLQI